MRERSGWGERQTRAFVFPPRADLPHVDRAQPEAAKGRSEQRTKASDAVDAGHGDEGHGKRCRAMQVVRCGSGSRGENACVATLRWGKETCVRLHTPGPGSFPGERGRLLNRLGYTAARRRGGGDGGSCGARVTSCVGSHRSRAGAVDWEYPSLALLPPGWRHSL